MTDHYKTLGIERTANPAEIKKAFRAKAKELHPDSNQDDPDAEQKMSAVNAAYDVLKDPDKRAEYDNPMQSGYRRQPNSDPYSEAYMRANRSGGWQQHAHRAAQKNNVQMRVGVELSTLIHGGTIKVPIQFPVVDPRGWYTVKQAVVSVNIEEDTPIGTTQMLHPHEHNIDGIDMLILQFFPQADPKQDYHIEGTDIYVPVDVDVFDALFGEEVEIDLPTGSGVRVTLPNGIRSGKSIRLANKGLRGAGSERGDVLLVVSLIMPKLPEETIEKIREIIQPESLENP